MTDVQIDQPQRQARIAIKSDFLAIRHGLHSLLAQEPLAGLSQDCRGRAEIVIAEALNNIVEHAYGDASGDIEILVGLDGLGLCCQISDHGRPMPNGQLPAGLPHILDDCQDLPEGGFGWFLIRSLAQDLTYKRNGDQNRLQFRMAT